MRRLGLAICILAIVLPFGVSAQVGPCGSGDTCASGQVCIGPSGAGLCYRTCNPAASAGATDACPAGEECGRPTGISQDVCSLSTPSTSIPADGSPEVEEAPFTPVTPVLGVPIPGGSLSAPTREGGTVRVAFLAEYINAVYRYLSGIILVVAIVMCVYGGFLYLGASAGIGEIARGKRIIIDSVMGMLIVLSAYGILNLVNPATTNLSVLNLTFVQNEAVVTAELGVDFDDAGSGATAPSAPGPGTNEDCQRLAQLVRDSSISVRAPNDREGLLSGAAIPRRQCAWCYNGPNRRGTEDDPCFDDPEGGPRVDPKVCKLLVDLHAAKVAGVVTGNISVACIICGHTRAAQGREDTPAGRIRCDATKRNIRAGRTGPGSGQSNHWNGLGIDLSPNPSIQRYIAETLFPRYGSGVIDDVIGPSFWNRDLVSCPRNADERSGTANSAYLCKNGRCNATWDANALCGHLDHIHVGFYGAE